MKINLRDEFANMFNDSELEKKANIDLPALQADMTPIPAGRKEAIVFPSENDNKGKIGVTGGAIAGALTSALVAAATTGALSNFIGAGKSYKLPPTPVKERDIDPGNYYEGAKRLMNDLRIMFTPLGVTCTIKNKDSYITVENIETSEMSQDMYSAWQNRDKEYFKNLLTTKMYSELQMAEKMFAKRFIDKHSGFQKQLVKKASADSDVSMYDIDIDEMTTVELFKEAEVIHYIFDNKVYGDATEKIAQELSSDNDVIELNISLDRPFDDNVLTEKIAGFLSVANREDTKNIQKKMLDKDYINKNIKISFLPDRVIFSLDGILVSTLVVGDMNEDGFKNFRDKNISYFKDLFKQEAEIGMARIKGKAPSHNDNFEPIQKTASASDIKVIFERTDIHPVVYFVELTKKFGEEWFFYDPMALIKIIEKEYGVDDVETVALNKIFSIQVANNSDTVFTNAHAFEKVLRSFCDKPVDFFERQIDDINIGDIAFCIDVLDRVTPTNDVYDDFSPEIYDYIVKILSEHEIYAFMPSYIVGSQNEAAFNTMLNFSLLDKINRNMASTMNKDINLREEMEQENEAIFRSVTTLVPIIRKQFSVRNILKSKFKPFTTELIDKSNVKKELRDIVYNQIIHNIVLDDFLLKKEDLLREQVRFFEIDKGVTINE